MNSFGWMSQKSIKKRIAVETALTVACKEYVSGRGFRKAEKNVKNAYKKDDHYIAIYTRGGGEGGWAPYTFINEWLNDKSRKISMVLGSLVSKRGEEFRGRIYFLDNKAISDLLSGKYESRGHYTISEKELEDYMEKQQFSASDKHVILENFNNRENLRTVLAENIGE